MKNLMPLAGREAQTNHRFGRVLIKVKRPRGNHALSRGLLETQTWIEEWGGDRILGTSSSKVKMTDPPMFKAQRWPRSLTTCRLREICCDSDFRDNIRCRGWRVGSTVMD